MFRIKKNIDTKNKLDESGDMYQVLFDNCPDGILATEIESKKIIMVSPSMCRMLGYSKEDLESMRVMDIYPKDDLSQWMAIFEAQARGEKELVEKAPILRKDGSIFYANINTKVVMIKDKKVNLGFIRDVTEKIESEKLLKESQGKLKNVIGHMSEMFYIHNRDNLLTYVSPQCNQITGYTQEEMMIKWTELITNNPINQQGEEITQKAFETGEKQSPYILELVKKDGQKIWVEVDESPIKNDKGEVVEMVGVVRDITEKKLVEERMKDEHDRTLEYLNLAKVMFLALDTQGKVTMINREGLSILGLEEKNVLGKDWFELAIPRENIDEIKGVFNKLMKKETELVEFYDNEVVTSKNERRMIAWHNAIITNKDGKVDGVLSCGEDVTERRESEKQMKIRTAELEKMNKLMVGREVKMAEMKKLFRQIQNKSSSDAQSKQVEMTSNEVGQVENSDSNVLVTPVEKGINEKQ